MQNAYTHIKIERVPQKLNEDFTKNADIADQQKMLAEAAPDLLAAVQALLKAPIDNSLESITQRTAAFKAACDAIAKATGE